MRTQSGFAIQDPYRLGISIALANRSLDLSLIGWSILFQSFDLRRSAKENDAPDLSKLKISIGIGYRTP